MSAQLSERSDVIWALGGGVLGFFIFGPIGALAGAGLGFFAGPTVEEKIGASIHSAPTGNLVKIVDGTTWSVVEAPASPVNPADVYSGHDFTGNVNARTLHASFLVRRAGWQLAIPDGVNVKVVDGIVIGAKTNDTTAKVSNDLIIQDPTGFNWLVNDRNLIAIAYPATF